MAEDLYGSNRRGLLQAIVADINPYDCLLDLIDNAIDAASNASDSSGNFTGYIIAIRVAGDNLHIEDNAAGMSQVTLERAFVAYNEHDESKIIGRYGIGLQRALYKLGEAYRVTAWQEGKQSSTGKFDKTSMEEGNFTIDSSACKKEGSGTEVVIYRLNDDLKNKLKQQTDLAKDLGIRYAKFIEAGLDIKYNASRINPIILEPKNEQRVIKRTNELKTFEVIEEKHDGLCEDWRIDIKVGVLSAEAKKQVTSKWDKGRKNGGWYVFLNDRCVLLADKTRETGWGYDGATRFHPQYNDFLGIVNIYSGDTETLPFDTAKSIIRSDHKGYQKLIKKLIEYNRQWASFTGGSKRTLEKKIKTSSCLFPTEWGKPREDYAARLVATIEEGQNFSEWQKYPLASMALMRVTFELALRHAIRCLKKNPSLCETRVRMIDLISEYRKIKNLKSKDKKIQTKTCEFANDIREELNAFMHEETHIPTVDKVEHILETINDFIDYTSNLRIPPIRHASTATLPFGFLTCSPRFVC